MDEKVLGALSSDWDEVVWIARIGDRMESIMDDISKETIITAIMCMKAVLSGAPEKLTQRDHRSIASEVRKLEGAVGAKRSAVPSFSEHTAVADTLKQWFEVNPKYKREIWFKRCCLRAGAPGRVLEYWIERFAKTAKVFDHESLSSLGFRCSVSAGTVGKWLIDLGLRSSNGRPSERAFSEGYVMAMLGAGNDFVWLWSGRKTCRALQDAGHTVHSPYESPFDKKPTDAS